MDLTEPTAVDSTASEATSTDGRLTPDIGFRGRRSSFGPAGKYSDADDDYDPLVKDLDLLKVSQGSKESESALFEADTRGRLASTALGNQYGRNVLKEVPSYRGQLGRHRPPPKTFSLDKETSKSVATISLNDNIFPRIMEALTRAERDIGVNLKVTSNPERPDISRFSYEGTEVYPMLYPLKDVKTGITVLRPITLTVGTRTKPVPISTGDVSRLPKSSKVLLDWTGNISKNRSYRFKMPTDPGAMDLGGNWTLFGQFSWPAPDPFGNSEPSVFEDPSSASVDRTADLFRELGVSEDLVPVDVPQGPQGDSKAFKTEAGAKTDDDDERSLHSSEAGLDDREESESVTFGEKINMEEIHSVTSKSSDEESEIDEAVTFNDEREIDVATATLGEKNTAVFTPPPVFYLDEYHNSDQATELYRSNLKKVCWGFVKVPRKPRSDCKVRGGYRMAAKVSLNVSISGLTHEPGPEDEGQNHDLSLQEKYEYMRSGGHLPSRTVLHSTVPSADMTSTQERWREFITGAQDTYPDIVSWTEDSAAELAAAIVQKQEEAPSTASKDAPDPAAELADPITQKLDKAFLTTPEDALNLAAELADPIVQKQDKTPSTASKDAPDPAAELADPIVQQQDEAPSTAFEDAPGSTSELPGVSLAWLKKDPAKGEHTWLAPYTSNTAGTGASTPVSQNGTDFDPSANFDNAFFPEEAK